MSDSRVDEYAACLERWRDEFAALRTSLSDTELTEAFKWRKPCYTHAGKNIVIFQPFNDLCALMFFKGALLNDPQALLREQDVVLTRPQQCALAYTWPVSGPGWNSGDLSWTAGAAGWHMTVDGLLDVMGRFRREGSILTPGQAQETLARGFAVDPTGLPRGQNADTTQAGPVYPKNGLQWNGSEIEQCAAYYLPDNMKLIVFVNSPVFGNYPNPIAHTGGPTGDFLLGLIAAIYADNLEHV